MNLFDEKVAAEERKPLSGREDQVVVDAQDDVTIPIVSEEITFTKREVETGRLQVHTTVHEHQEIVDEPLLRKTVSVEVVPIDRQIVGEIPVARQEGDTYVVPVLEERLIVEKRLFLKEEVHIRTEQITYHKPQSVMVRQTEVAVERFEPQAGADTR